MAICLAMIWVLPKLFVWKISPGLAYCIIFKGFRPGPGKNANVQTGKALVKVKEYLAKVCR